MTIEAGKDISVGVSFERDLLDQPGGNSRRRGRGNSAFSGAQTGYSGVG
jgi:hypothetical protein